MSSSLQWFLWLIAITFVCWVAWIKLVHPLWEFIRRIEKILPILDFIQSQFIADSGTSMRDLADRLDKAAVANAATTSALGIVLVEVLGKANLSADMASRVASDLATAQKAVDGVAADLAQSHKRADDTHADDPAGSAADAASRQSETDYALDATPDGSS